MIKKTLAFFLQISIGLLIAGPLLAQDVAPPAADETLIYVIRPGRILGGAAGFWIGVNDKTVARVRNKKHAIIRAKAGLITLNLANSGAIAAATTVDDRPGETVYLKWRLGDTEITELDEAAANKLMRKTKLMKPLDAPRPNNEADVVLLNISRLGIDVMRPQANRPEPDGEHAVITVFRRGDARKFDFGVWSDSGFVATLSAQNAASIKVPAGRHHFMAGNLGTSLLRADVEAGGNYYFWVDYGAMMGRVRLTPVEQSQSGDLDKWLSDVTWVEPDPDAMTVNFGKREEIVREYIRREAERADRGDVGFALVASPHRY